MRIQLVINRHSRRGREAAPAVLEAFAARGIDVLEASFDDPVAPNVDALVGAGGDGTLVALIGKAVDARVPLGLVPLGTFNELARTLAVPPSLDGAVDVIASAETQTIDVARVNGVYYINEASIGISARVTRLQTPELKQRFGLLGVLWTTLQAFRYAYPMHIVVEADGVREVIHAVQLTIANSNRFGGIINVSDASLDDGWLDLYAVQITNLSQAFHVARAALQGRREEVPGLRTLRARRFHITTRRHHHITADGEEAGKTPATFEVLPAALHVLVPKEFADGTQRTS